MIHRILDELNESNSSNYKIDVLKKYKDNALLQRILKMTSDHVTFTYGIKKILPYVHFNTQSDQNAKCASLEFALDFLSDDLCNRKITGNAALEKLKTVMESLEKRDAELIEKILDRDLKINVSRSTINKVWKGMIVKPCYTRCDIYSKKTAKNIAFPAILQLKADGRYAEFSVENGKVKSQSRSGEENDFPLIFEALKDAENGVYTGELTVRLNAENLEELKTAYPKHAEAIQEAFDAGKTVLSRSLGNGLINSSNPPHKYIILDLWDYITLHEYSQAAAKDKKNPCKTPYEIRLEKLWQILETIKNENIRLIDTREVQSLGEALKITSEYMDNDLEGSILKAKSGVFKDGTSKHQLKLKLEIDCEVRITGFEAGNKGSKNEDYFSSITFVTDDGKVQGRVGVTSMTESTRDELHANRDNLIGKIMTVQFNDLSKAEGNDYFALSHPRFIEVRDDKTETDTLERILESKEMAMQLS